MLTLHLKRFRATGRRVHKLDAHVAFPLVLDLSPFACGADAPRKNAAELLRAAAAAAAAPRSPQRTVLRLYALIEHQGTFSSGHYVALVRLSGGWYRMSDSQVTRIDEAAVLATQAFMLFYERVEAEEGGAE